MKKRFSPKVSTMARLAACFLAVALLAADAEKGMAVYYSNAFQGKRCADGSRLDQQTLIAAHKTLPFGTKVKVTNPENSQSVVVTVTDRMSRRSPNAIDLTRRAAHEIGIEKKGRALVSIEAQQ